MQLASSSLRLWINLLGAAAVLAHLAQAALSYIQMPALWRAEGPRALAFFESLYGDLNAIALYRHFASKEAIIISYWIPLFVASAAALVLVLILRRAGERLDAGVERLLFRWALAFAGICVFAFPVFTQDLWLSGAWGRMVVAGVNPYHHYFTSEALAGLPLDHFPMVMSYGPAWALVSAAVAAVAGSSVALIGILFKALLAAAWIGSVVLIGKITAPRPLHERCLTLALIGWIPLSVTQTVAEGHNDIVMAGFALLWFRLLLQGRAEAPLALVGAALTKYVTAPLFVIDLIVALCRDRIGWRRYLVRLLPAALYAVAAMGLFYRSPHFFDGVKLVNEWHFLQPRDAIVTIEIVTGLSLDSVAFLLQAFFPVLAVYWVAAAALNPATDTLIKAILAIMASVLFTVSAHVWPWYVLWVLVPAVLLPGWWLSRFCIGVAFMVPFMAGSWWVAPFEDHLGGSAFILYVGAILCAIVTRPLRAAASPRSAAAAPGAAPSHAAPVPPVNTAALEQARPAKAPSGFP